MVGWASVRPTDDDERTLSIDAAEVIEGDPGESKALTFTVTLSEAINEAVTFRVDTADFYAVAGQD